MMFIEIKEDKFEKIAEYTEKMLKYGGKIMSCLSEIGEEYGMNFREDGYGNRYGERGGMNYRDGEDYRRSMMGSRGGSMGYREDDDDDEMNERRGRRRRSNGRYY